MRMHEGRRDEWGRKNSRVTMSAIWCLKLEGVGKGGRQWKRKGARVWDRGNIGVCRGVMVCFNGNESKMDAVANFQTALSI